MNDGAGAKKPAAPADTTDMNSAGEAIRPRRSLASVVIPRAAGVALEACAVLLIALYAWGIVTRNTTTQWDFRAYWSAARVALAGLDPYLPANLATTAGRPTEAFVYPLVGLVPFLPWAALPVTTATLAWAALEAALLVGLVALWKRRFVPGVAVLPLVLVAVFGWSGSSLMALRSGNVALLEAALLWSAFACLLSGRRAWFAGLVVAAACFKLLPAVFLLLLWAPAEDRGASRRSRWIAGAVLVSLLAASLVAARLLHWTDFFRHLSPAASLGASNPSAYALFVRIGQWLGAEGVKATVFGTGLWFAFAVGMVAAGLPLLRRAARTRDLATLIMASVFLYVLLSPRVMAYGFVLLAPVPLFFSPAPFRGAPGRLMLALVLAAQGLGQAAHHQDSSIVYVFAPMLLSVCLWLLVTSGASAHDAAQGGLGSATATAQLSADEPARERR